MKKIFLLLIFSVSLAVYQSFSQNAGTLNINGSSIVPSPWDKGQVELAGPGKCPIVFPDYFVREREFLGYQPRFQPGMISFSPANVPVISIGVYPGQAEGSNSIRYSGRFNTPKHYLQTLTAEGKWVVVTSHTESIRKYLKLAEPDVLEILAGERVFDVVEFDNAGNAYTIVSATYTLNGKKSGKQFLLSSTDGMKSWQVLPLPAGSVRLEPFRFHTDRQNPLTIVGTISGGVVIYLPQRGADGLLKELAPIQLTDASLKPNFNHCVTAHGKTFVAFMSGVASPEIKGALQYVVSYDQKTGKVEAPVLLGSTGDIMDGHNAPVIDIDSKGFLYVMGGAHWHTFKLWKSKEPVSITAGWTDPEPIGSTNDNDWSRNGLTYPRFVIDRNDWLHLVARGRSSKFALTDIKDAKVRTGFGDYLDYALVYFRKKPGGEWEPRQDIAVPKWMAYSNWYHKLVVDQNNTLYLTYYYFAMNLTEDAKQKYLAKWPEDEVNGKLSLEDLKVHDPVIVRSSDQGTTWEIAQTADFVKGMTKKSKSLKKLRNRRNKI